MGVATGPIAITSKAAESLKQLKETLGDRISVDLMIQDGKPDVGQLMIQYEDIKTARKMMDRTAKAVEEAGFSQKDGMVLLSRNPAEE